MTDVSATLRPSVLVSIWIWASQYRQSFLNLGETLFRMNEASEKQETWLVLLGSLATTLVLLSHLEGTLSSLLLIYIISFMMSQNYLHSLIINYSPNKSVLAYVDTLYSDYRTKCRMILVART